VLRSLGQSSIYSEICPPRDVPEIAWLEPSCFSWISIDNKIQVDYICKMESIDNDIGEMCEDLGLEAPRIPHVNISDHRHYTQYYDDETQNIVAKRYAKDIEHFGYVFGS
jgi:hypothetical protein